MDRPILSSALLFWSSSFNCFHLLCGAMSVNLFDINSLTRLPCTGEEISALLTMPPGVDSDHKDLKPSYPTFVRSACDHSLTKEFIPLAVALAHNRCLALGPFLLAYLYKSCQDVTVYPLGNSSGPLWILQLWLYSYFPTLVPVLFAILGYDLLSYGLMFKDATENKKTFEECFKFFASFPINRLDADFAMFLNRSHGPSWYKADIQSPDFRAFWSVCVTS
ncbi:hypothetical protein SLEP1_g18965 [Rubroshorea leprosula]|uniref:Aminotransferase-like plant mobile domain-containing protein n=1 Tax=Rubroshorea leprosula TaxID=152421 RepID=A0AAV5J9U2_9ROSI|nr:hypothetical protein SLEP1_g18965 [Rubroshorea leprosula]